MISTTAYREYSSVITNRYSPLGNGPQKSALRFCHGFEGSFEMFSGSIRLGSVVFA